MKMLIIILLIIVIGVFMLETAYENYLRTLIVECGFPPQEVNNVMKIMRCESSFNPYAHALSNIEDSRGLMQINVRAHPEYLVSDLYNPKTNLIAAYNIYLSAGRTFKDWSCAKKTGVIT